MWVSSGPYVECSWVLQREAPTGDVDASRVGVHVRGARVEPWAQVSDSHTAGCHSRNSSTRRSIRLVPTHQCCQRCRSPRLEPNHQSCPSVVRKLRLPSCRSLRELSLVTIAKESPWSRACILPTERLRHYSRPYIPRWDRRSGFRPLCLWRCIASRLGLEASNRSYYSMPGKRKLDTRKRPMRTLVCCPLGP